MQSSVLSVWHAKKESGGSGEERGGKSDTITTGGVLWVLPMNIVGTSEWEVLGQG